MLQQRTNCQARNEVATKLLDLNYDVYMAKNMELLVKDMDVYGVGFFGDGAAHQKMPYLNIICSGIHIPAACIEIVDCMKHLENSGRKDVTSIASLFLPFIEKFNKRILNTVNLALFNGTVNVQKVGNVLAAFYPQMSVVHEAEHVMLLF